MERLSNSSILITGAHGQLGSELTKLLEGSQVTKLYLTDINQLDITNEKQVLQYVNEKEIDIIINCAAYNFVEKAEQEQPLAMAINHNAVAHLAKAAKANGALLIHISTDFVFNGKSSTPYTEDIEPQPLSIYGKSKMLGEKAVLESGAAHLLIRTSWLYSSYGSNFVKSIIKAARANESIRVVFDQVGTPTYAADLAEVIVKLCKRYVNSLNDKSSRFPYGVYHYSNEGVASWYDFAYATLSLLNIECKVLPIRSFDYPSKVERPSFSLLDKSKIKSVFNIDIPHWQSSLVRCIQELSKEE